MKRLSVAVFAAALAMPAAVQAQAPADAAAPAPEIVPQPATKLPLKHAPQPTTDAITAADLMTRLYIYADDSMMGREAGTPGNFKATTYIAGQVEKMGLEPAGDSGTYFQTIPLKTRAVDSSSSLTAGGAALTYGSDWAVRGSAPMTLSSVPAVFGGALGDSQTVSPADMKGKLVVFALGQNRRASRQPEGSDSAAALAIIVPDRFMQFFGRPSTFVDDPDQPQRGGGTTLFLSAGGAAKLFGKPVDSLAAGAAGPMVSGDIRITTTPVADPARNVVAILPGSDPSLKGEYVAIGAHNDHIGMTDRPVDHDSLRIFNHIVRPGGAEQSGKQATPAEQARVNAELAAWRQAHPGTERQDSISNGADDDGSGTVGVLEIAQHMASLKGNAVPKRSILFVWHVGEEKGLLGSAYFTDHPTVPRDSIVAQLNMDMIGRGDKWDVTGESKDGAILHGGPNYLQIVGSRRLSDQLGDLIEKVNTEDHHGLHFDYAMDANGHPMNIYCRSDHYEYARYGIPIAFFTTGGHSDYHQVTDEPEYIDYQHMAAVVNLVDDVARHVANLDHRIVVDHPKPDPHGACQQ